MSKGREDLATVLRRAHREISRDRGLIVDSCTLKDKRGRPRMETLEEAAMPDVRRKDLILAAINRVLG